MWKVTVPGSVEVPRSSAAAAHTAYLIDAVPVCGGAVRSRLMRYSALHALHLKLLDLFPSLLRDIAIGFPPKTIFTVRVLILNHRSYFIRMDKTCV